MWRCSVCGYVWDGEEAPDECPKCGSPKEKYVVVEEKAAELIERSRFTNSLHMQLFGMLEQVMDIAEEGIDDNLDPACVKVFERALGMAETLTQSIKAELQSHMNKGKWG